MTLVEALKVSDIIRRKGKALHVGSHGDGWVHIDLLIGKSWATVFLSMGDCFDRFYLTKDDLLADDWEARLSK